MWNVKTLGMFKTMFTMLFLTIASNFWIDSNLTENIY